ncbi:hypothetical protein D3C78_1715370 [compost metagenome]
MQRLLAKNWVNPGVHQSLTIGMAMPVRRGAHRFGDLQPDTFHRTLMLPFKRVNGVGTTFQGHKGERMITGQLRPLRHVEHP